MYSPSALTTPPPSNHVSLLHGANASPPRLGVGLPTQDSSSNCSDLLSHRLPLAGAVPPVLRSSATAGPSGVAPHDVLLLTCAKCRRWFHLDVDETMSDAVLPAIAPQMEGGHDGRQPSSFPSPLRWPGTFLPESSSATTTPPPPRQWPTHEPSSQYSTTAGHSSPACTGSARPHEKTLHGRNTTATTRPWDGDISALPPLLFYGADVLQPSDVVALATEARHLDPGAIASPASLLSEKRASLTRVWSSGDLESIGVSLLNEGSISGSSVGWPGAKSVTLQRRPLDSPGGQPQLSGCNEEGVECFTQSSDAPLPASSSQCREDHHRRSGDGNQSSLLPSTAFSSCPPSPEMDADAVATERDSTSTEGRDAELLYLRYMQLVVRRTPVEAQPLCHSCWGRHQLPQLRLKAHQAAVDLRNIVGAADSYASLHSVTEVAAASSSMSPQKDTGPFLLSYAAGCGGERGGGASMSADVLAILRGVSIDCFGGNLYGAAEQQLLSAIDSLSSSYHGGENWVSPSTETAVEAKMAPVPIHQSTAASDEDVGECEMVLRLQEQLRATQQQEAVVQQQLREAEEVVAALEERKKNHMATWSALAQQHNKREAAAAGTTGDETSERRTSLSNLQARLEYLTCTAIDALSFPIDVTSYPIGTIAGLRLGLAAPYSGATSTTASAKTASPNSRSRPSCSASLSSALQCSSPTWPNSAGEEVGRRAVMASCEEALYFAGVQQWQTQYTQVLLSGHHQGPQLSAASRTTAAGADSSGGTASSAPLVSPAEVNAACGCLLNLLSYMARVNGFSFRTAVLQPHGSQSTVAILREVRLPATATSAAPSPSFLSGTAVAGAVSAALQQLSLWRPSEAAPTPGGAESSLAAPSLPIITREVDRVVDFFLTDRFLAWRTFGEACVAVAGCVAELCAALQESLRCWQQQEQMSQARPVIDPSDVRGGAASVPPLSSGGGSRGIPAFFPSSDGADVSRYGRLTDEPQTPPGSGAQGQLGGSLAAVQRFPISPPYTIRGGAVDGFSVRHGQVPEAIWTLGMKKLLANVDWCVKATAELERLFSVAEAREEGEEKRRTEG